MKQGGKGRRTRRRGEVRVEAAMVASSMREWLSDRLALAQKRNAAGRRVRPSGYGVTLEMKAIAGPTPLPFITHTAPNREMRRRGAAVEGPLNRVYVNRESDEECFDCGSPYCDGGCHARAVEAFDRGQM